jgi:hypothetical protein
MSVGTRASALKDSISSASLYSFSLLCLSGETTPHRPYLRHSPTVVGPPHRVCPGLLGSQVPLARSQKAPPLEVRAMVSHVASPAVVAHLEVPADQ